LPKNYEIGDFFKKKFLRLIPPLAFWSLVYIIFSLSVRIIIYGDKITLLEIAQYVLISIQKGSAVHLWYVYMIIGIYLFIPIIGKWARNCSEKEILYFLIIWLFTLFLNQPIISKFKPGIDLTYFTGYLGYLILGYYLSTKSFKNQKKINIISILFIVIGFVITAFGTYFESYYKGVHSENFYSYLTPNVFILSIGIFIFFKNKISSDIKHSKIRNFINKYSYGIYLSHILILSFLYKIGIKWILINPIIGIPFTTLIGLVISGGVVFYMNKLPFGKYISGLK